MTAVPPTGPRRSLYHRSLGWHAPALPRAILVSAIGLLAVGVLVWFVPWQLSLVGGWDLAALVLLASVWPIIVRSEGAETQHLATREDETRGSATVLLVLASLASLFGVFFVLGLAGREGGTARVLLIVGAFLTVLLSWTVVNTVYTLHYAHLYFVADRPGAVDFGDPASAGPPTFRDFAYLAFTIGMTYQVSDNTLRSMRLRRSVLSQALLSYLFGVVIVAGAINLIAGLVR